MCLVFIEASDKDHVAVQMLKFGERRLAVHGVDDPRIELPHNVNHPFGRQKDVSSADVSRVGEQLC